MTALAQPIPNVASVVCSEVSKEVQEISLLGNLFCDFGLREDLKFFQDNIEFDIQLMKILKSFRV